MSKPPKEIQCKVTATAPDLYGVTGRWCQASERDAAEARAIAAEQMVAELRAMLTTGRDIVIETSSRHTQWVEDAYDTLQATAPRGST